MRVTVDVAGEDSYEIDLEALERDDTDSPATTAEPGQASYADLLERIGLSPHEVSVLVDGRPVPEDQPVESTHVTVVRLIKGG